MKLHSLQRTRDDSRKAEHHLFWFRRSDSTGQIVHNLWDSLEVLQPIDVIDDFAYIALFSSTPIARKPRICSIARNGPDLALRIKELYGCYIRGILAPASLKRWQGRFADTRPLRHIRGILAPASLKHLHIHRTIRQRHHHIRGILAPASLKLVHSARQWRSCAGISGVFLPRPH